MFIDWTRHLKTDKEKEDFRQRVVAAQPVLERLKDLLDEKTAALERSEFDPKSFDSPSWAYLEAYKLGVKANASGIRKLIDLDNQVIKKENS